MGGGGTSPESWEGPPWSPHAQVKDIELLFIHKKHKNHKDYDLPAGWDKIEAGEFQIAMAPRWKAYDHGLRKVFPDALPDDPKTGWQYYFQALPPPPPPCHHPPPTQAGSRRQLEAVGGRQHRQ